MIEFALLGALAVRGPAGLVPLGPPKQRQVLVRLLLGRNQVVTTPDLIDDLWPDRPPSSATANLRMYVANLRRSFSAAVPGARKPGVDVARVPSGYRLAVSDSAVDIDRFGIGVARAHGALSGGDTVAAVRDYTAALGLWRGRFVEDLPHSPYVASHAQALWDTRLTATEQLAVAHIDTGQLIGAIDAARELVRLDPLREGPYQILMTALYARGEIAGALTTFRDASRLLAAELGTDPSADLRRAHRDVLSQVPQHDLIRDLLVTYGVGRGEPITARDRPRPDGDDKAARNDDPTDADPTDPDLSETAGADVDPRDDDRHIHGQPVATARSNKPGTPNQLPADTRAFSGRTTELSWIDAATAADPAQPTASVISAIFGAGGIGKTALAVHWAHRARDRYPDGQLYVNLRGFDPNSPPMDPADALRGFLSTLGVAPAQVPSDPDAVAATYRSLLADRRMIVVLDNARDTAQILALLPGSAGCVTLVTSRNHMHGLVATAGARALTLDRLPARDSRQVLAAHLGEPRLDREPASVEGLLAGCAGLPIALTIIAARAAIEPDLALAALASELSVADSRLNALATPDPSADARGVFQLSYQSLTPAAARMFEAIGLNPGPTVEIHAAASAAGRPVTEARAALRELVRSSLLTEYAPDRFSVHDLVRAYAVEVGRTRPAERQAGWVRLYEHYLHTARAGDRLIEPTRDERPIDPPGPDVSVRRHTDSRDALAWFADAQDSPLLMIDESAGRDDHARVCALAFAVATFLDRSGNWAELARTHRLALGAAIALGRRDWQISAHYSLARAANRTGRSAEAIEHLSICLRLAEEQGDSSSAARVAMELAMFHASLGDNASALTRVRVAYDLFLSTGDEANAGRALNGIGWFHAQLGQYDEALVACTKAVHVLAGTTDRHGQADALDSLGFIQHQSGNFVAAVERFRQAHELFEAVGDKLNAALILDHLGDAARAAGDADTARQAWTQAVEIFDRLDRRHGDAVHAKLAATG